MCRVAKQIFEGDQIIFLVKRARKQNRVSKLFFLRFELLKKNLKNRFITLVLIKSIFISKVIILNFTNFYKIK